MYFSTPIHPTWRKAYKKEHSGNNSRKIWQTQRKEFAENLAEFSAVLLYRIFCHFDFQAVVAFLFIIIGTIDINDEKNHKEGVGRSSFMRYS
jgi:hypothetical protein